MGRDVVLERSINHSRAVLNSLYLSQQRLPIEPETGTATVTRARRARTESKAG